MSQKVRVGDTVRYENATGNVTYLRVNTVTAVPKSASTTPAYTAGAKRPRIAWVNA